MGADAANSAGHAAGDGAGRGKAPGIDETLRELAAADFALARGALGRSLVLGGIAALLGSSAWLLLTVVLVAGLHALGLDWVWALLLVAVAYLAGAGICAWRMRGYLEHIGMRATRRQLSRLRHPSAAPAAAAAAPEPPPNTAAQGAE